jgi:hypothetical protein
VKLTNRETSHKWVTGELRGTSTNWVVIDNLTSSSYSTGSRTRIYTFLIDTSLIERTFWAGNTLRSASWWTADITGYARTYSLFIYFPALTIRATR